MFLVALLNDVKITCDMHGRLQICYRPCLPPDVHCHQICRCEAVLFCSTFINVCFELLLLTYLSWLLSINDAYFAIKLATKWCKFVACTCIPLHAMQFRQVCWRRASDRTEVECDRTNVTQTSACYSLLSQPVEMINSCSNVVTLLRPARHSHVYVFKAAKPQ